MKSAMCPLAACFFEQDTDSGAGHDCAFGGAEDNAAPFRRSSTLPANKGNASNTRNRIDGVKNTSAKEGGVCTVRYRHWLPKIGRAHV